MKADISTLHKPDILILRRQSSFRPWRSRLKVVRSGPSCYRKTIHIQLTGSPMNRQLNRSGMVQGGRRIDTIRAVTLESRIMNADRIFSATKAVRELIEDTFGKTELRDKTLTPESKLLATDPKTTTQNSLYDS